MEIKPLTTYVLYNDSDFRFKFNENDENFRSIDEVKNYVLNNPLYDTPHWRIITSAQRMELISKIPRK